MSKPSICVGCRYARWDRDSHGKLSRSGNGKCMGPDIPRVSLPAAFRLAEIVVEGGAINRYEKHFNPWGCLFKDAWP